MLAALKSQFALVDYSFAAHFGSSGHSLVAVAVHIAAVLVAHIVAVAAHIAAALAVHIVVVAARIVAAVLAVHTIDQLANYHIAPALDQDS